MSKRPESKPAAPRTVGRSLLNDPRVTVALCVLVAAASLLALIAVFPGAEPSDGAKSQTQQEAPVSDKQTTSQHESGSGGTAGAEGGSRGTASRRSAQADPQALLGVWNRPGESYFLEIRRWLSDGTLEAAYFNPRPIKVAKATWRRVGENLTIMVELRDVGYPGSTYKLAYRPEHDILAGEYFQAATGATYQVEFVRVQR